MDDKKLNEVALSFLGTPHINGGNLKGAGVDCCTLPALIYKEVLGFQAEIDFGYSGDWFCRKHCKEILLPYLEKYCDRVENMEIGDTISYRWGRAEYAHLAVYLGNGKVIHCSADFGTDITDLNNPAFFDAKGKSRVSGIWRLKK